MRYEKGHKEKIRDQIVTISSEKFRKCGVQSVGIAGIMADAGLTHGGFYAHFKSKEALLGEALTSALEQMTVKFERVSHGRTHALDEILRIYLNKAHQDAPGLGCPAAALTAEVARHSVPTRKIFSVQLRKLLSVIENQLHANSEASRSKNAIAVFSLMIGALQLARAESDEKRAEDILEAAFEAASALGERID